MNHISEQELFYDLRDAGTIKAIANEIAEVAKSLPKKLNIMEVCGGHTHTIMRYGINQMLPANIEFIHGPGCPVCIMPKERIDHAIALARQPNVILVTLGDMIKVPGSKTTLAGARADGADVRFVYSPMDALKIAEENPQKTVIYFAIGFETTTPMSAALLDRVIKQKIPNLLFHINHVTVPEPIAAIMDSGDSVVNAFIAPAHVSVITGAKIYRFICEKYHAPVVAAGFEPVDIASAVLMIAKQAAAGEAKLEIEYVRSVTMEGNLTAQKLIGKYFEKAESFRWRGLGDIPNSSLKLKKEYAAYDAEIIYAEILPKESIDDHKLCICADILKGKAKPTDCKVFAKACTPSSPLGSCMVSSEGACAAYYKYGQNLA